MFRVVFSLVLCVMSSKVLASLLLYFEVMVFKLLALGIEINLEIES